LSTVNGASRDVVEGSSDGLRKLSVGVLNGGDLFGDNVHFSRILGLGSTDSLAAALLALALTAAAHTAAADKSADQEDNTSRQAKDGKEGNKTMGLGAFVVLLFLSATALASPADAGVATPAAPAAPQDFCDRYGGDRKRECEREGDRFCSALRGREEDDCRDYYRRGRGGNNGGGRDFRNCDTQRWSDMPEHCRRECEEQRGRNPPAWCVRHCNRLDRNGDREPNWCRRI